MIPRASSRPPVPRSLADVRDAAGTVRRVLTRPAYAGTALAGGAAAVVLSVLARNPALVGDVLVGGRLSMRSRLTVFVALLPGAGGLDPVTDGSLLLVGALTGVALALAAFRVRRQSAASAGGAGASTGLGVVAAALGGCASCGSALLAAALGTGLAGGLAVLPFGGTELLAASVALLLVSIYWLAARGDACRVDR
ncbi:hypothetical protein [Halomicrobium salinisoli]|uniref:hypothetical protein n=1 Tax=Halomicrobium salinisoli TaxID=2878391 RepID=UPI001CEFB21C|nr:hypothetical protein [Halomicrobium salinisoli]